MTAGKKNSDIGQALRRARQSAGLTLEKTAQLAELSKGYLSKIESGRSTPSVHALIRLSDLLGIPVADLLTGGQPRQLSVVRSQERALISRRGTDIGYIYELASAGVSGARVEAMVLTVPPGKGDTPWFSHSGEELFFVLSGRLRFFYAGVEYVLDPGDCVHFDATAFHRAVAEGKTAAKIFVVMAPQRNEAV